MAHRGDYAKCRFCPKCGVDALEFDRYGEKKNYSKAEFVCRVCGFGFRIMESARVAMAAQLFKRERQVRTGKFQDGVTPEAAEAWLKFTEKSHDRWYQRILRRGTLTTFKRETAALIRKDVERLMKMKPKSAAGD